MRRREFITLIGMLARSEIGWLNEAAAAALIRFLTSSKILLVMKKRGMELGAL